MLKGSIEVTQKAPESEVENLLRIQRELMSDLSHAVDRTRGSFAKALGPERGCNADGCGSEPTPERAPIVDALMSGNTMLASILADLHSINDRSVL